jgi:hypothetical protein
MTIESLARFPPAFDVNRLFASFPDDSPDVRRMGRTPDNVAPFKPE